MENTFIFQQDNHPKHTALVTQTWFLYYAPRPLETPPQSPDLNPIENLGMHLENEVRKKNVTSKDMATSGSLFIPTPLAHADNLGEGHPNGAPSQSLHSE
ncbi:hypothetical protein TNCV_4292331 [Trichonephila clavipes]|uniref:Tc1-like transposase DDE domain-containing protein n=1 Tax=Trichonephila clavipes TaxID=2585209 RepID=A0A8X6V4H1_TRICX|nr:hypothetical protein TNCV_4292331 [Trichonephila clavipes]